MIGDHLLWMGLTPELFLLAAGRYMMLLLAVLLFAKHIAWFVRGYHTPRDRRANAVSRAITEMVAALFVAAVYGMQLLSGGAAEVLFPWGQIVQVYIFSAILLALVVTRDETNPPPLSEQ